MRSWIALGGRRFKTNLPLLLRRPLLFARFYWWPLLFLLTGAILDGLTTYANVRDYGAAVEAHPIGRMAMETLGPAWGTSLGKGAQFLAAVFVASLLRFWCRWLLLLCGVIYAVAAYLNHFQLV